MRSPTRALLDGDTRFPVLLLSPMGFPPLFLAALAEELASAATWWSASTTRTKPR